MIRLPRFFRRLRKQDIYFVVGFGLVSGYLFWKPIVREIKQKEIEKKSDVAVKPN